MKTAIRQNRIKCQNIIRYRRILKGIALLDWDQYSKIENILDERGACRKP
jgi:hypothetical protein